MTQPGTSSTDNTKKIVAIVAIVLGSFAVVIGIAGAVAGWGSSTTKDFVSANPSDAISPTLTAPKPAPEKATAFVKQLDTAIRSGDSTYLFTHLHSAVIARYGATQCQRYLASFDRSIRREVRSSPSAPGDYAYTTDGQTTDVPDVLAIAVDLVAPAGTQRVALHTAEVDGTYRWFTDCGKPTG
jgi:hypothetical protein